MVFTKNFKKFISAVLAATMVSSMSVVAFAADGSKDITVDTSAVYTYDSDSDTLELVNGSVEYGEDVYIAVGMNDASGTASVSDLDNYRVMTDFTYGRGNASKAEFDVIKVEGVRKPVIKIPGKFSTSTKETDVVADITITGRSGALVNSTDELVVPVTFTYAWDTTEGDGYVDSSAPVVYFDGLDEVTLEFDGGVEFTVNASNQDDLFLKVNNDVDTTLVNKYDDANLDFVNFAGSNKTFNKTGTAYVPYSVDKGTPHIYVNNGGVLTEIKDCYDKDEEAFIFKTKTLGDWVISDKALDVDTDSDKEDNTSSSQVSSKPDTSNSSSTNTKPNPDTGR